MPFLDNDGVTRLTTDYLDVFARKEDAILDPSGGLIRTDDGISVDSLIRESDGAISGSITELTAEGHAEQFSTTGKNLVSAEILSYFSADSSEPSGYAIHQSNATRSCIAEISPNTTYTMSAKGGNRIIIGVVDSLNPTTCLRMIMNGINTGTVNHTFVTQADDHYVMTYLTNDVSTAPVEWVQLELGSTATEYEPYTGGLPSPRPDWEQPIEVVRGRNLIDESILLGATGWQQASDGSYYGSNTNMHNYTYNQDVFGITFEPNTQYTMRVRTRNVTAGKKLYFNFVYTDGTTTSATVTDNNSTEWFDLVLVSSLGKSVQSFYISYNSTGVCYIVDLQITLDSTPQPYVPYGHVGMEVQGKNLVDSGGLIDSSPWKQLYYQLEPNTEYTISTNKPSSSDAIFNLLAQGTTGTGVKYPISGNPVSFTTDAIALIRIDYRNSGTDLITNYWYQLEKGSLTDYEPYYHSITPIPLPQRGWVAGLPDGTTDSLRIDGAGKVEWTVKTKQEVKTIGTVSSYDYNGRKGIYIGNVIDRVATRLPGYCSIYRVSTRSGLVDGNVLWLGVGNNAGYFVGILDLMGMTIEEFRTAMIGKSFTLLYPLATPVTEDCGYIDPPSIDGDCTISIPELDALNVKYFVDDSAGALEKQWYERAVSESDASIDQRIELVESNIATIESTTAKSNHAVNSYFMLDNVLRKATSAIASGETISNSNSSPITVEQVITALNNSIAALEKEVVFAITPSVSHRNIYRGKNLGTAITTAQKAQIAAGTFDDLYVGDYWTINGRVYRIADINYYYNSGDTAFTKNHLVIVPDASFGNDKMNDTNITTGAYKGSKMYTDSSSVLNTARTTIANDFGSALATHRIYLQNAVTNGYASAGEWADSTVDLMNEPMVYGSYIFTPAGNGSISPNRITVEKSQLALFRLNHRMINPGRYGYWLQDVVTGAGFAVADSGGNAGYLNASASRGVRPDFCIVGD